MQLASARPSRDIGPAAQAAGAAIAELPRLTAAEVRLLVAAVVRAAGVEPFESATLAVRIPGQFLASITVGGREWNGRTATRRMLKPR